MSDTPEALTEAASIAGQAWTKPLAGEAGQLREIFDAPMGPRTTHSWILSHGPGVSGWLDRIRQSRSGVTPTSSEAIGPARLELRLAQLEEQAAKISDRLAQLESSLAEIEVLAEETLTPAELSVIPGLELSRLIPIVIEESATDAVARWIEPGLAGVGGSEGEALESLREEILAVWHDLDSASESELTRNTQVMRQILRSYVEKAS